MSFLSTALTNFTSVGAIAPFSKTVVFQALKQIHLYYPHPTTIVEFWPGSWVFTNALLYSFKKASLAAFEINTDFYQDLKKNIRDNRFTIFNQCASTVNSYFSNKVDCIVSTLPFVLINKDTTQEILRNGQQALRSGGLFIIVQYSDILLETFKKTLHESILIDELLVIKNIPPAKIFVFKKQ